MSGTLAASIGRKKALMLAPLKRTLRILPYGFLALVYLYLLAPAFVLIFSSFNSSTTFPGPFESFTFRWYKELLLHDEFMLSMRISLLVAAMSATIATLIGAPAAFTFVRSRFRARDSVSAFFLSPLVIPQIVLGLSMLQLLNVLGVGISMAGLVLIHAVFIMPYALRAMMTSLTHFDGTLEEAAKSLGASRLRTLWYVTLPLTRAGFAAGFVLAFIMSFVNVPLSLFLAAPGSTTFPIRVFAYMESRLDPLVAAVGAFLILVVFATSLFLERVLRVRLLV